MPVVTIEYDGDVVSAEDMQKLADASHKLISKVTGIEDVPVYAHNAEVKAKIAPIEIFIRLSAHKVHDTDALTQQLKQALSAWKHEQNYPHPINMSFIPMNWNIEIDI